MPRMNKRFLDCSGMSIEEAEAFGRELAELQRDIMFWIGDLAKFAEVKWPQTHQQVWPEWISPGMIARAAGVCRAYPAEEDRSHECTYSQYMQAAGRLDRQERLAEIVANGLTTDESRKPEPANDNRPRWLAAFDVHYFLHRFWFSGAGVESALGVSEWVRRTVERLREKGLTDLACCFDSPRNSRKELTSDWEDKYKDRPPKDPELGQQLRLVRELLEGHGFACVSCEGWEADDVMASYAAQFPGRVTLVTQDKDCKQCLAEKCNMLLDVEWLGDETGGEQVPTYKWLSAKQHFEATGLTPEQWIEYQVIAGDPTDGIKGVIGIGEKGAVDLVKTFGSVDAAIAAARAGDERIREKKRDALIAFDEKHDITRRLVTLRTDLQIPMTTRLT